ncbi:hypothetical protein D3C73_1077620 [compost metagenome]
MLGNKSFNDACIVCHSAYGFARLMIVIIAHRQYKQLFPQAITECCNDFLTYIIQQKYRNTRSNSLSNERADQRYNLDSIQRSKRKAIHQIFSKQRDDEGNQGGYYAKQQRNAQQYHGWLSLPQQPQEGTLVLLVSRFIHYSLPLSILQEVHLLKL